MQFEKCVIVTHALFSHIFLIYFLIFSPCLLLFLLNIICVFVILVQYIFFKCFYKGILLNINIADTPEFWSVRAH